MYSYLALGDSYTIGEQVAYKKNFPNQAVALLQDKGVAITEPVIIATTGWTTDELAAGIMETALNEKFHFVSLLIGVNNQYRGRSSENYAEEFSGLLQQAIAFADNKSEHVFVLSIPDWGQTPFAEGKDIQQIAREIDAYNAINKALSLKSNCQYIDITSSTRANAPKEGYLVEDKLHPSELEYAIWAEQLAHKMQATL